MAPPTYSLQIPSTSTVQHPQPHTVYNISLTNPLQTLTIQKRYSDFTTLHAQLTSQADSAPPVSLPPKTYLPSCLGGRTKNNPALIETRRRALETYLQTISSSKTNNRWRETSGWRAFLNLPSTHASNASSRPATNGGLTDAALAADPALWLDTHREVKSLLQEARKHVSARNNAETPAANHEANVEAKSLLVKAGGMISVLERGLKAAGDEWGRERLGEGEMRRRRDLVSQARREKDDLESLLSKIGRKQDVEAVVESLKTDTQQNGTIARPSKGRVLGKETAKTRELDNTGVLQLQQQMMREQDEDIDVLTAAVLRQRELAMQINSELVVQNELLGLVEEDVDRVDRKIKIASKRVDKIS